jgi:hypothetical protein
LIYLLVCLGSADCTVRIWQISTTQILHIFSQHQKSIRSLSFSISRGCLFSVSDDSTIRVWNLTSPEIGNVSKFKNKKIKTDTIKIKKKMKKKVKVSHEFVCLMFDDSTIRGWNLTRPQIDVGMSVIKQKQTKTKNRQKQAQTDAKQHATDTKQITNKQKLKYLENTMILCGNVIYLLMKVVC